MTQGYNTRFIGRFNHSLDAKDRLTIPSKWRASRTEDADNWDFYLMPRDGAYISVFTEKMMMLFEDKMSAVSLGDVEGNDTMRNLLIHMDTAKCTTQGRISLNAEMLSGVGIERDVVLVGKINCFEIWNPETLEKQLSRESGDNNQTLMRIGL